MIKEVAYKLKWRLLRPQAFSAYARLVANEKKSADELAHEQELARQAIVREAFARVPFYHAHYSAAGFELGDIGREGWFERLPIVTKAHLRERFGDFFDPALKRYAGISTTGGSTGEPTKTAYDLRLPIEVYSWRQQEWFGVHPWDHHAYVWRDTCRSKLGKFKNAAMWWPTRHLKLDASFMDAAAIADFLARVLALRPKLLYGYVGAITQVAQFVVDHPETRERFAAARFLKFVWVTSAPLSGVQRRLIETAFGVPVCDQYGSCEIRGIAQQCPCCQGLHVNTERVHVEFVDAGARPVPTGDYGRALLTNLEDRVFPLIRYENGDRGRWLAGTCACGRPLPCIDSVKGREVESFVLPSGKTINGEYLTTLFDATPDVTTNFRVVQHRDLSITVEYVPGTQELPSGLREDFVSQIGNEVSVTFVKVASIAHDRGKIRYVVRE